MLDIRYRAAWLLSGAARGSGGFLTVLVHARSLLRLGIESSFYFYDRDFDAPVFSSDACAVSLWARLGRGLRDPLRRIKHTGERMREASGMSSEDISRWYLGWDAHRDSIIGSDMVFATTWDSAYALSRMGAAGKRFYFVQDREHYFHPGGDNFLMAEHSYGLGFHAITIGRFLCRELREKYSATADYFDFGADLSVYRALESSERESNSIAFIFQPKKSGRCPRLGLEALRLVKSERPGVRIYLYGSRRHHRRLSIPFDYEHLGLLDVGRCNALYNRAAVGLCLSAGNPSRVSFEMMASGLPVVELYGENTIYDLPEEGVLLSDGSPRSLASAVLKLLDDEALRRRMGAAGVAFMGSRDRETVETARFGSIVDSVMRGESYDRPLPSRLYQAEAYEF